MPGTVLATGHTEMNRTHCPLSLLLPALPFPSQCQNPAPEWGTQDRAVWGKAQAGSLGVRTPGCPSTTLGLSGLGHSLASGSPLLDKMGPLVLTHCDR